MPIENPLGHSSALFGWEAAAEAAAETAAEAAQSFDVNLLMGLIQLTNYLIPINNLKEGTHQRICSTSEFGTSILD